MAVISSPVAPTRSPYSIREGTISYEARRTASVQRTRPKPTRQQNRLETYSTTPFRAPFDSDVYTDEPYTEVAPPMPTYKAPELPDITPDEEQIIPLDEFIERYPGFDPAVYQSARETGLRLVMSPDLGGPGAQYDPGSNALYFLNGQPLNSIAHEFVHYAHTQAPQILNTEGLSREQKEAHRKAVAYMGFRANTSLPESLVAFGTRAITVRNIVAGFRGNLDPMDIPGQSLGERISHSLAGNRPQTGAFPASYFSPLFADPTAAARIRYDR